jgi:glucosylceramidase
MQYFYKTSSIMYTRVNFLSAIILIASSFFASQSLFSQEGKAIQIASWITNPDRSALFENQSDTLLFSDSKKGWGGTIVVDDRQEFQDIDGFGFALTGGSAGLIMRMSPDSRKALLQELFSVKGKSIGVSYLRISIGASDLNDFVFSYDDLPNGETDFELRKFSLGQDLKDVVPVLKEILAICPDIKILGSPWSAPAWMKTNSNVRGGSLKKECYDVYARYFVKYIQTMEKEGITLDAITIQNEPLNSKNTPSMKWLVTEQASFIRDNLGKTFRKEGIKTKIILFDHNCDRPDYPLALLSDPALAGYVDGSGFHHYGGDLSAMSMIHQARPDKNLYFTEQMVTEEPGSPAIDITDPVNRLIIGATRNWSKNVILWNLAADPLFDPHTNNGGCSMCQGAITIDGDRVSRNIGYFTVAHASKFVRPGSVRIATTNPGDNTVNLTMDEEQQGIYRATVIGNTQVLPNVAFRTPKGKIVLIVANDTWSVDTFNIQYNGQFARIQLRPGAVGTYVW